MTTEATFRDRLAGAGKGFVLGTTGGRALEDEARLAFEAMNDAVLAQGGWLVEDGVRGATAAGFANLMLLRSDGAAPWEAASPVGDGTARSRERMKLPASMLVFQGFPCWALAGRLLSLDLFNPANELNLSGPDTWRYWYVVLCLHGFKCPMSQMTRLADSKPCLAPWRQS